MNVFSLRGKRAFVAGASRGIGLAIAKALAAAEAEVVLAARSADALDREAQAIRTAGGRAATQILDVADEASIAAAAGAAGEVDILVNVSGTNVRKRFADYTPEEYGRILQTNLHGLVLLTQKIGPGMIERGRGGKIINIGSLTSGLGLPYLTPYAITKSGIAGMTRVLAAEWGRHNIQVNCIAPGFIETDLNRAMWQAEHMRKWLASVQANPRMGTPEDIAPLAVFLSSAGADYITGQVIYVDGGYSTTAIWPFEPSA